MTRWDTDNLNAAHTQRELDQEWGGDGVSDLVKRLRSLTRFPAMGGCHMVDDESIDEAADRIEQLERELAEAQRVIFEAGREAGNLMGQLAAEKALADKLGGYIIYIDPMSKYAYDYRKARGL